MPSRSPRKILKITRSRSSRPQYTSTYRPNLADSDWYYLAASQLVLSGRKSGGAFWPLADWYYVPADSHHVAGQRRTSYPDGSNGDVTGHYRGNTGADTLL